MLKLTQKTFTDKTTNKSYAFVEPILVKDGYTYKLSFDKATRFRINNMFRSLGFRVGELNEGEIVPDKVLEI